MAYYSNGVTSRSHPQAVYVSKVSVLVSIRRFRLQLCMLISLLFQVLSLRSSLLSIVGHGHPSVAHWPSNKCLFLNYVSVLYSRAHNRLKVILSMDGVIERMEQRGSWVSVE
ncbi:a3.2 [Ichnoviriform fugitivi]|uniref:A3.2 n=1 Tax=Ichnoviriform fugitivi TaxID=265522 RepID=A2Q0D1_9VIRU|nr:a3.2 [Ichnoviriform fugitivi]BAF45646.1 a3.2 [Ichnoviriform fugitivi]